MTGPEVTELLRWIDQQHRAAMAECIRLERQSAGVDGTTAAGLRRGFALTADVAAATGRLEAWNEVRQKIRDDLHAAGIVV